MPKNTDDKKKAKKLEQELQTTATRILATLLDNVEYIEPLGANHWARVAKMFRLCAEENNRPTRDADSILNMFDKLENTKKKTGYSSCPSACSTRKPHFSGDPR